MPKWLSLGNKKVASASGPLSSSLVCAYRCGDVPGGNTQTKHKLSTSREQKQFFVPCLSVCLVGCLSIFPSVCGSYAPCLSVRPIVHPSERASACLSVSLCPSVSVSTSVGLSVCLSVPPLPFQLCLSCLFAFLI